MMNKRLRVQLALAAVALACFGLASVAAAAPAGDTPEAPKPCCFINERYAGVCRVVAAKGETCETIEAYLNNPSASGRTYCDNTNIRGGWTRADCKTGKPKEEPPATPPATLKAAHSQQTRPTTR